MLRPRLIALFVLLATRSVAAQTTGVAPPTTPAHPQIHPKSGGSSAAGDKATKDKAAADKATADAAKAAADKAAADAAKAAADKAAADAAKAAADKAAADAAKAAADKVAADAAPKALAGMQSAPGPAMCDGLITGEAVWSIGAQKVAKALGKATKEGSAPVEWGQTGDDGDFYVVAIGPDGRPTGPLPNHMTEDKQLVVVLYNPVKGATEENNYDFTVTGCEPVPVRVLGSFSALKGAPEATGVVTNPPLTADARLIGRCSADSTVTISVTVPIQPGYCPKPSTTPITFKTDPVYSFTVALGAMASFGKFYDVGVDPGVGGAPGVVFERTHTTEYNFAGVVMFYPWGLNPNAPFTWARRFAVGTAIPLTSPISTANILVGLALVPGLQVAVGMQLLHKDTILDSGLQNGSVFNDDSSTLPTHQEWRVDPAFILSVSVGTQLLSDIKGH